MSTPEDRHAYLNAMLIGGREPVTITVIAYDDVWPVRFAHMRALVEAALGIKALAVEHIGSTSIPGLAAKPIVDMLLTVASVEDEDAYVPALGDAGFVLRVREPGTQWSFDGVDRPLRPDLVSTVAGCSSGSRGCHLHVQAESPCCDVRPARRRGLGVSVTPPLIRWPSPARTARSPKQSSSA